MVHGTFKFFGLGGGVLNEEFQYETYFIFKAFLFVFLWWFLVK
jgi:hypothetical protein